METIFERQTAENDRLRGDHMAKPNFKFQKRQKELDKKKKQEEKQQRKQERAASSLEEEPGAEEEGESETE